MNECIKCFRIHHHHHHRKDLLQYYCPVTSLFLSSDTLVHALYIFPLHIDMDIIVYTLLTAPVTLNPRHYKFYKHEATV